MVHHCLEKDLDPAVLSREDLRAFHAAFPAAARDLTSLDQALERRGLAGGTARKTVEEALRAAERAIESERMQLDAEAGDA
jgi:argininosuccinate lyase